MCLSCSPQPAAVATQLGHRVLPVLTWLLSDCAPTVNHQPGADAGHAPTPAKFFCSLGSGKKALQDLQWGMGRMQCPGHVS